MHVPVTLGDQWLCQIAFDLDRPQPATELRAVAGSFRTMGNQEGNWNVALANGNYFTLLHKIDEFAEIVF